QSPNEFPSLKAIPASGLPERFDEASVRTPRTLTTRYLGSTTGVSNHTLFFDQLDFRRSAGLYSDLYAFDRRSGQVRRLTREARLLDPDVSPDGRTLVAAREGRGARDLVTLDLD